MHVLATIAARKQDSQAEFYWLKESLKVCPLIEGYRGIAILKARTGFHASALKDLGNLIPLIRHAEPLECYDFLNSYAVELAESGRIQEARNISKIVINSPFAFAYPEWQGTANDLRGSSRSFVAFNPSKYTYRNVLPMPEREHGAETKQESRPARVFSLQKWKKKMAKGKQENGDKKKPVAEMSAHEMLIRVLDLFGDQSLSEEKLRRMLEAAEKAALEPDKPTSDE